MHKLLKTSTKLTLLFRASVVITLIFIINACSSGPGVEIPEEIAALENLSVFDVSSKPTGSITFNQAATIRDSDDLILGRMGGIAVDSDENVFFVDRDEQAVRMFRPDGSFGKSIGRSGSGPGEFRDVFAPIIKDDHLYVIDFRQLRISAFRLQDHSFSHTYSLGGENSAIVGFPTLYQPLSDGDYLIITSNTRRESESVVIDMGSFRLDSEGRLVQKDMYPINPPDLFVIGSGNSVMWTSFPFHRRPLYSFSSDEEFYYADTDRLLIKVFDTTGNLQRAIYYPYQNIPLSRDQAFSLIGDETLEREARSKSLPATLPALSHMVVDDKNRIWIQLMNHRDEPHDWWVLDSAGEKKATFTRPSNQVLQVVKGNYAYFREADEETGLQEIVKYEFRLES